MRNDDPTLYIGMVDFNEPTLLILGDPKGLFWLADLIESRWAGKLSSLSPVIMSQRLDILVVHDDPQGGLLPRGVELQWGLSRKAAGVFPEQLRGLARSENPGHAYLDEPGTGEGSR